MEVLGIVRDKYAADPDAAKELIAVGEAPQDASFDAIEHAAYTGVMNVILNLDEVVSKE
jgi:hypothetical protein